MQRVKVWGLIWGVIATVCSSTAVAAPPVCDGAMALRINQSGLDFITEQVKPLLPSQLDIPPIHSEDWPVSNTTIDVAGGPLTVTLHQLLAQMDNGTLRVQGKADVLGASAVDVDHSLVPGVSRCQADVQLRDLSIDLALQVGTQAGKIQVQVTQVNVSLDNDKTVIKLNGCVLGSILTAVVNFVRKYFMDTAMSLLEKMAKDKIAGLVGQYLDETIQITKEVQGFVFTGRLDELRTDPAGVQVGLGIGVGLRQPVTPGCLAGADLTPPASCVGVPVHLSSQVDAMFGAGVSEAVINQALHTVWSSGMLCISSDDAMLATVAQSLNLLGSALGQPQGTEVSFGLRMLQPPRVRMSLKDGLELRLSQVMLKLTMTPPGAPSSVVLVKAGLAVGGIPWIDPAANVVSLDLRTARVSQLEVLGADGQPAPLNLDPARLQRFIATVAMPVLRERLANLPLTSSVISLQSFLAQQEAFKDKTALVELKSIQIKDGYLAAYVDGHVLSPSNDKQAPETTLVQGPGAEVGPQVVRFTVTGKDSRTPVALLRYRARVDGGQWTEPAYGGRIDVTVHGGTHMVEIAAVDHDGNVDPSPLVEMLTVDDVMPQLSVTSRPDSLLEEGKASLGFVGRDDRTPPEQLRYTVELYRVPDGGGMPALQGTTPVSPIERRVQLSDLSDGVYSARVIVADAVGNVTSQDVGFVVASDVGCSLSGAPSSGSGLALLLLALVALLGRRRG